MPHFEIYFAKVLPEQVPNRTLYEAIEAVQMLASGQGDDDAEASSNGVRVINIRRGSAAYGCVADEPVLAAKNFRLVGQNLERGKLPESMMYALHPIEMLAGIAKRTQSPLVIRTAGKTPRVLAIIQPSDYGDLVRDIISRGPVSVIARVERVGGANDPRAMIRISGTHRVLFCDVATRTLAKELGKLVYDDVQLDGEGKWLRTSRRLTYLKVGSVRAVAGPTSTPDTHAVDPIDALRAAGGSDWDHISNPAALLGRENN